MNNTKANICVFGASPGTGNQGVNALCWSTLAGLAERGIRQLDVFDYGLGSRSATLTDPAGDISYQVHGLSIGKRFWRANHPWRMNVAARAGGHSNPVLRLMRNANAILDVSGGDSFTDLYGASRFNSIVAPKRLALALNRPLVLLPQTYGPFADKKKAHAASDLIAAASLAYARDRQSYWRLQDLLGTSFDPTRHRQGVDLAFGLIPTKPRSLTAPVAEALCHRGNQELIGINVSGLIANRPEHATRRFDLACDYLELMRGLIRKLLDHSDARILLVPHVHAPVGHYESDLDASYKLLNTLPARYKKALEARVTVVTQTLDARELKWLIAQTDWFCGTRMHATIAGLSSGVPTAALAYSLKTQGVFGTCGMHDCVVDLRSRNVAESLEQLLQLWHQRGNSATRLVEQLAEVRMHAAQQLDEVAACVQSHGGRVKPMRAAK
jgi:polysaccharide pyruvyl transferase WcaK-like protein